MTKLDLHYYDAVAFDVEGTLANTLPTHHVARAEAFARHGFSHITREQMERGVTVASSAHEIIGSILYAAGEIEETESFKDHELVRAITAAKIARYEELAADGFEAMPGAVDFVHLIAERFPGKLALVTSSYVRHVLPFLERYDLRRYFTDDVVISQDVVESLGLQGKPLPDPYRLATQRLSARRLLVFEDTVPGTTAAKRAGSTVMALGFEVHNSRLFRAASLEFPPDAFVADYTEARQLLGI